MKICGIYCVTRAEPHSGGTVYSGDSGVAAKGITLMNRRINCASDIETVEVSS